MRIFSYLAILVIAATTFACAQQKNNITPEQAKAMLAKPGVVLVDVRTPDEYSAGHLAGAINVNFRDDNFQNNIAKVGKDKNVVVYCASGRRSAAASEKMTSWGWKNVSNIIGGIEAWSNAGLPITK